MAVSCASAKPSFSRALFIAAKSISGNSAINEGATLAMTFLPEAIISFTRGTSSRICFASWGQFTKQRPHRMHSSGMIFACPSANLMLFTGQLRMHL